MALTVWANFYDYILPDLMGVTSAVADLQLRLTCRDLCEQALMHSEEVAPIDVVAGTAAYTLTPLTAETEVVVVKAAWYDDVPLDKSTLDVLNDGSPQWRTVTGTPRLYVGTRPDQITLYPEPDASLTDGLRVEVNLRPTLTATGVTDWIATTYIHAIAHGVKARLMAQPGKPWSNPDLAGYHNALYEAAKTRATIDTNRSFTRAGLSVRPRPAA